MNFFVPNHDDKARYFSSPCHFRFGIQKFPTPCVIYQNTFFDLPPEWFWMIVIYLHFPLSWHILMVFCFMFLENRRLRLANIGSPMLLTALKQSPAQFTPINFRNTLLWTGITLQTISNILTYANTTLPPAGLALRTFIADYKMLNASKIMLNDELVFHSIYYHNANSFADLNPDSLICQILK